MNTALLDRELNSVWLDTALKLACTQLPLVRMRDELYGTLKATSLGEEALIKTTTALTRIWLVPTANGAEHIIWALEYADKSTDWRPLHLGAMLAGEPFIAALLEACGREHRAKGEIDTIALRERMRNIYGPKRGIDRATQRGVKTLRSLGILEGLPQTSISRSGCVVVTDPTLAAWLVRCLLLGRKAESIAVDDLRHAPELFGIALPAILPRSAPGISRHVEGVGRTVLALNY